jgi:hypothetical protein
MVLLSRNSLSPSAPSAGSRLTLRRAINSERTYVHAPNKRSLDVLGKPPLFPESSVNQYGCRSHCSSFASLSERSQSDTWAGSMVSLTTPTRSALNASRSVSWRNLVEKASKVFLVSYFLL